MGALVRLGPPAAPAPPAPAAPPVQAAAPLPASPPKRLHIPSIAVDSELVRLGLAADQTLEVPTDFDLAGWYLESPTPGEMGPAVIAGHVDSREGPAVFYRLAQLRPGDEIHVDRADGSVASFRVDRLEQVPKDRFPTQRVYGDVGYAALRLITCGGEFDRDTGHYRDNVVVYASLTSTA
jgi:LPXTG-site transpeptidase (sortase) family protein